MPTRREFLGTAVTATAATLLPGLASAEYAEQPDHVTIKGNDEVPNEIETYRPLLDLSNVSVTPSRLYAWKVTSDEYDADWYCYWAFYSAQQGVSGGGEDSHLPDREPIYLAVTDDGVDRVIHSEWHYSVAIDDNPSLYQDTHPRLRVIEPWHGTTPTETNLPKRTPEISDWARLRRNSSRSLIGLTACRSAPSGLRASRRWRCGRGCSGSVSRGGAP
jgi:hypothetical protein